MQYEEVIFETEERGKEVIQKMSEIMDEYHDVRVADIYDLIGFKSHYENSLYGWHDISKAELVKVPAGYALKMPEPIQLAKDFRSKAVYVPYSKIIKDLEDKMVSHPDHYQSETGLEVIDVIEAFTFDLKGIEATDTGNIIKYICRWKKKNGLQDLKKARFYLDHLINHVEKMEKEND